MSKREGGPGIDRDEPTNPGASGEGDVEDTSDLLNAGPASAGSWDEFRGERGGGRRRRGGRGRPGRPHGPAHEGEPLPEPAHDGDEADETSDLLNAGPATAGSWDEFREGRPARRRPGRGEGRAPAVARGEGRGPEGREGHGPPEGREGRGPEGRHPPGEGHRPHRGQGGRGEGWHEDEPSGWHEEIGDGDFGEEDGSVDDLSVPDDGWWRRDRARGEGPRGEGPRGDGPRGGGPHGPRGDGPRGEGPRGDGPRGERGEGPRGERGEGPRGERGEGPRGGRRPRGEGGGREGGGREGGGREGGGREGGGREGGRGPGGRRKQKSTWTRYLEVFQLALPLAVAGLAGRLSTMIHAAIVAREPTEGLSVAAVIVGGLTFILVTIPAASIAVGVQALVSRKAGEDRTSEIGSIITTGLLLACLSALVFGIVAAFGAPAVFQWMGRSDMITDEAIAYLHIRLLALPAYVVVQIFAAVFIALNHPSRALMVVVGALILDTAIAAYLVPTLGVEGAAFGSLAGECVAAALFFLQWPSFAKQQGIKLAAAANDVIQGIRQVAGPISVRRVMRPVQVLLLLWILGQLNNPTDLVVGAVLIKLSLLAQAPGGAFGKAAAILASHDLGGEKKRRARKRPKDALIAAMVIMGTLAVLGLLFPDPVLRLYLKTDAQVDHARTAFRVVCVAIPMMTITGVYATTLLAIGASRTVAWMAVLLRFVIALPLSWLVAVYWGWGVLGVVAVDAAMSLFRMVLSLQAISRPRWTQVGKADLDAAQIDDGM